MAVAIAKLSQLRHKAYGNYSRGLNGTIAAHCRGACRLTNRWSGRVKDKVPSSNVGARAAQLNR